MLLSAVAVTVVVVSWVVDSIRHEAAPAAPPVPDTQLSEQPLVGLGGGVTVRELTQGTPFSMVALTGDLAGTSTRVRAKRPNGSWGPWYQTEYETEAPDSVSPAGDEGSAGSASPGGPTAGPRSTDPVFVGTTTTVQIAVTRPIDAPVTQAPPVRSPSRSPEADGLGYRPASKDQPFGQTISAILISPPQAPARTHWTPPSGV